MPEKSSKKVEISVDQLAERAGQIAEIDAQIASATGNDSQARKAVIDGILAEHGDTVVKVHDQVMSQFAKLDGEVLVGLVAKLEESLKGDLQSLTSKVIDEKVAATATVKPEDVAALKETRKAQVEAFRALKTILDSLGLDTSEVQEPKRSGGGRPSGSGGGSATKTGNNKEGYRYMLDGKGRPVSQNSFSSLAYYATEGVNDDGTKRADDDKGRMTSKALKEWIAAQGVKFGEDDTWELTLTNGRKIGARRLDRAQDEKDGFVFDAPAEASAETETAAA